MTSATIEPDPARAGAMRSEQIDRPAAVGAERDATSRRPGRTDAQPAGRARSDSMHVPFLLAMATVQLVWLVAIGYGIFRLTS